MFPPQGATLVAVHDTAEPPPELAEDDPEPLPDEPPVEPELLPEDAPGGPPSPPDEFEFDAQAMKRRISGTATAIPGRTPAGCLFIGELRGGLSAPGKAVARRGAIHHSHFPQHAVFVDLQFKFEVRRSIERSQPAIQRRWKGRARGVPKAEASVAVPPGGPRNARADTFF
jgi:hypothetical protein